MLKNRQQLYHTNVSLFLSRRKAKEALKNRQMKALKNPILVQSGKHTPAAAANTSNDDFNTDVEMPSTQEVFAKVCLSLREINDKLVKSSKFIKCAPLKMYMDIYVGRPTSRKLDKR